MIETIVGALLPIAVILLLGYFAGWHQDFNKDQAGVLNRMVMLYALPLSLFAGLVQVPIDELMQEKTLSISLFIGMIVLYFVVYFIIRYLFKKSISVSALLALSIAGPAVPFVGVSVLGDLFGNISTISISICSIYMNLIQVPITIILLSMDSNNATTGSTGPQKSKSSVFWGNVLSAIKEPVVWMPVLGLIFLLLRVSFPTSIISSLNLLGKATGGVALFASGIILFSYKVTFNKTVSISVLAKNILLPLLMLGILHVFNFTPEIIKESVITLSIPTASIGVILAIQYKSDEQDISSILFFSTMLSLVTMGLFMYILS